MAQIITTTKLFNTHNDYRFASLVEIEARPKQDYNTKEPKRTSDGKQLYTVSGLTAIVHREDGTVYQDNNFSVNLLNPIRIEPGKQYVLGGDILYITPWVKNGRTSLSVVCERLDEVKDNG